MISKNFIALVALVSLFSTSCGQNRSDEDEPVSTNQIPEDKDISEVEVINTEKQKFIVDTIATGLQNPWGMVFLPGNKILITERPGRIRIVENGQLQKEEIKNVPDVHDRGQGGLLDIQLHPDYQTNGWIYFSYSKPGKGGTATTVSRAKLSGNAFTDVQEVFVAQPFINSNMHFGCRLVFDNSNYLYISTGERGTKANAQKLNNHYGKVLRIHDDGKVPADNPFVNTTDARPEIWCYGNRNIQGLYFDKKSNVLWAHEHGPRGGDEINIIQKGKNYGWPVVTYGIDYDGSIISSLKEKEGIEPPVHVWTPSIAPCGMTMVTSNRYPEWKGNLLVGALVLQHVARVEIKNNKVVSEERLLEDIARVRDVREAPDGFIYILTENPGMFLKLVPQ